MVTDAEGEVYEHMEYTPKDAWASSKLACDQPYGEKWILDQNDNSKYDMIPYRFTAKEYDEETGLYYMSARYQNPEAGRLVSSDPAGWGLVNPDREGFSIIESMNPYSYCSNNPINYRDPTGLDDVYEVPSSAFDDNDNSYITDLQKKSESYGFGADPDS